MKKVKYFLMMSIMFVLGINRVSANTLKSLDINVYIGENGSANITEVWNMNVNKGTEVYKPMYNLGDRTLSNFKVRDEKGTTYTTVNWDINASLSQKKNKSGINYTSQGKELCWGMGSYGDHIYTINYDLSDVITTYNDAQATLWKLVNDSMDPAPNKVRIVISSYYSFPDTLDVWGYGYKGYAYVKDGKIYMESEDGISRDEYMVLLAKFPLETFSTNSQEDKTFDELHNQAEEGTFEHDYDDGNVISNIIFALIPIIINIFVFGTIFFAIFYRKKDGLIYQDYNFGTAGRSINKKEVGYYRDIPCNKDIFRAYWVAKMYGITKKDTDFFGAVLLKWLKEKQIKIITKEENKLFGGTKQEYSIDLTKEFVGTNELERELYSMLTIASKDNYLENKEFEKWCSNNYTKVFKWFDDVIKNEREKLISEGKITVTEKVKFKVFKTNDYLVDASMKEEAKRLQGLKNYLNDFSIINKREAAEVVMFEEYLIYAQIFGIAKKVADQFKKLYPQFIESNPDFNYNSFLILDSISTSGISKASSARSAAQAYSSGGGGFSSGGGGGGSFGGGSGGGCR